jgi:hypothetical protein
MIAHIHAPSAVRWRLTLALGFLFLTGCSGTPAPLPADENQARQTLDRALASWQKGETVEAMKNAKPSIVVSDPSWGRGQVLKRFEVGAKGKAAGAERVFSVTLWLANSKGEESRQEVDYKVGTQPILTVFRAMF